MEKAKDVIIRLLLSIAEQFPQASFKYGYDLPQGQHLIEVSPLDLYEQDDFMLAGSEFVSEFVGQHPYDSVLFVTEQDEIRVESVLFEIMPSLEVEPKVEFQQLINQVNDSLVIPSVENFCFPSNIEYGVVSPVKELSKSLEYTLYGEESWASAA